MTFVMYKRKILNREINKQSIKLIYFSFIYGYDFFACLPRRMSCESVGVGVGEDQKWDKKFFRRLWRLLCMLYMPVLKVCSEICLNHFNFASTLWD